MLRNVKAPVAGLRPVGRNASFGAVKTARRSLGWEWAFLGLMAAASVVLTVFQFRWTGEVARAELERRRGSWEEGARAVAETFDRRLNEKCQALLARAATNRRPEGLRPDADGWIGQAALVEKTRGTARMALVILAPDGRWVEAEWPAGWGALRRNLQSASGGGAGGDWSPFHDPEGLLLEFPLHGANSSGPPDDGGPGGPGGPGGGERWLIVELAREVVLGRWLRGELEREAETSGATLVLKAGDAVLLSAGGNASEPAVKVAFNHRGRGSPGGGPSGGRGDTAWRLEVHARPGALEALVAAARRRNLLVASALNALLLAAGAVLVRQARRARLLAEARMTFVATVSHELRTPLTVIRGAAHNIRRGIVRDPERVEHYTRLIESHAEQLGSMVEQVLDYARRGRMDDTRDAAETDLEAILRSALSAVGEEARAAGCQVEAVIAPDLPRVRGDVPALRRLFENLLVNAVRHGGAGGWIGLSAAGADRRGGRVAEVRVMDRGPGVPEAEREEIFTPFGRGRRARETQVRGSGIGLSLARETARAHGGDLVLEASETGAVFRVRLPAAPTA